MVTGSDGIDYRARLKRAYLLSVEVSEGMRETRELTQFIHEWFYAMLETEPISVAFPEAIAATEDA